MIVLFIITMLTSACSQSTSSVPTEMISITTIATEIPPTSTITLTPTSEPFVPSPTLSPTLPPTETLRPPFYLPDGRELPIEIDLYYGGPHKPGLERAMPMFYDPESARGFIDDFTGIDLFSLVELPADRKTETTSIDYDRCELVMAQGFFWNGDSNRQVMLVVLRTPEGKTIVTYRSDGYAYAIFVDITPEEVISGFSTAPN